MKKTYKILVVEDSPADAYVITEAFKASGYPCELLLISSHSQAKEHLADNVFDLILSDFGTDTSDALSPL